MQDEPSNMGALTFVTPRLARAARRSAIRYASIARAESASPATGSHKAHVHRAAADLLERKRSDRGKE